MKKNRGPNTDPSDPCDTPVLTDCQFQDWSFKTVICKPWHSNLGIGIGIGIGIGTVIKYRIFSSSIRPMDPKLSREVT